MFRTEPLISFSSKVLCDFPIIYGLSLKWEGLAVAVSGNYILSICSKYSYLKHDMGVSDLECCHFN